MIKTILAGLNEVKVDRRKKYIMCLDVETANGFSKPLIYDMGFAITDKKGNIYQKFSFVIEEIFDNKELMDTAYYKEKVPMYLEKIANGETIKVSYLEMREVFLKCLEVYRVDMVAAYNLNFDMRALRATTEKLYGKGKRFLTSEYKDIDLMCIWSFCSEVLYSRASFINFIDKHNYMTEKGNPLTNAEVGYQYITNNTDFKEKHMGLDDVLIECKLLAKCFAQKKAHESGILNHPWRIVADYKKSREEV